MNFNFDLLILSNGPGEITTWVLPVVEKILADTNFNHGNLRISVILSPCPNATGKEVDIVRRIPQIDRVLPAANFFSFLLWGNTPDNWTWHEQGLVLFLGGDQFFALTVAKRLGYKSLIYAEWDARWYRYIDYFAIMNPDILTQIPHKFRHKFTVVGDLMADQLLTNQSTVNLDHPKITIGLLPGSKASKLTQGVPFLLAIAEYIDRQNPEIEFIIPVAPTINSQILAGYAQGENNYFVDLFGGVTGKLIEQEKDFYLQTSGGIFIKLITQFPCYQQLKQCQLCLTTVGANTAQLGALAIPMIILIPTYQLNAMKSWDGLPGLLANLPLIGDRFASLINKIVINYTINNNKLYGWPNIWAKKEIVPELIGNLKVSQVGDLALNLLTEDEKLNVIKDNLKKVRGESGASQKIADIVLQIIQNHDGFSRKHP